MTAKEQGKRLLKYITKERKDVLNIYFYAILSGLVQLSLPLGIQAIISFAMDCNYGYFYLYSHCICSSRNLVGRIFQGESNGNHRKNSTKNIRRICHLFSKLLPKIKLRKDQSILLLPELINRF